MMSAMDLKLSTQYDPPPTEVFAMMSDPAFREASCRASHAVSYDVTVTESGGDVVVRVEREQATDRIPDFAKKFVGATISIVQVETWHAPAADGSRSADVRGEIRGTPASFTGTAALTPSGGGTLQTADLEVRVAVPLIGKKVEPYIAEAIESSMVKEQEIGQSWHDTTS
jgi:uncharacterized protein YndB with AHSA1/START domain